MYIAIIAMVIMTFLSRTNRKFCILVMVGTQFALCKVLKDFYKERRPEGCCTKSNGFPSAHSSFVAS